MHVAVLGAGYAGLTLTRLLERELPEDVEITLVNESPNHLVQHELHRVIRRPAVAGEISLPLRDLLERADLRVARVEEIDREGRRVVCAAGDLEYDYCAICLGAETAFYGLESVREHALPLKRLEHAERIRAQTLDALETEEPRLVVGGAGLSGVQVAGELAALAREAGSEATVTLLEQYDEVAPQFPANFRRALEAALLDAGVEVQTGETVVDADPERIACESGTTYPHDAFVWAGGIAGSGAMARERPTVRSDLRLADHAFALGDAVRVVDAHGQAVPASAQAAVREARTAAENLSRLVEYEREGGLFEPRLERFTFESPGWIVSVGDDAVAQVGSSVLRGRAANAVKTTVGVGYHSAIGDVRGAVEQVQRALPTRERD
ncbi:NAD(P)/FAD-dependent oxidoreductase [Natrononativus amylolyticus]|uniref:NAD(P)/FAD-dependent oxidoreductase n=1 Tax=Natrononativus amylolyticus TaxID=2963434 RepID=UPI0020CF4D81|nr:FAD-dependent oxidoreductase [Natrononativus amylolyticus]